MDTKKFPYLHIVRGVAALVVAICHAKFAFWIGGTEYVSRFPRSEWNVLDHALFAIDMASSNGSEMVVMFFVLSGFFMAYSFEKNNWKLREFYVNRLLRIYIPFMSSLLFATAGFFIAVHYINPDLLTVGINTDFINEIKGSNDDFNLNTFLHTSVFKRNEHGRYMAFNFPYWSLYHEALFYIMAPLVVKFPKIYLAVCSALLLSALTFLHVDGSMMSNFIFHYSFYFALGIMTYHWVKAKNYLNIGKWSYLALCAVLCVVIIVGNKLIKDGVSAYTAGLLAVLLINYIMYHPIKDNFLVKKVKVLGKVSYTLYLFHMPIYILLFSTLTAIIQRYEFHERIYYWLGATIAVLLSIPVYKLIEEKSLDLLSRRKKAIQTQHTDAINPTSAIDHNSKSSSSSNEDGYIEYEEVK